MTKKTFFDLDVIFPIKIGSYTVPVRTLTGKKHYLLLPLKFFYVVIRKFTHLFHQEGPRVMKMSKNTAKMLAYFRLKVHVTNLT